MTDTTTARQPRAATPAPIVAADLPPHALIWELATLATLSRCLHAVAQHGVADAVDRDGSSVGEVAERLGLNEDALGRVLRALAAY
ncbi:MAG: hypothetical protein ACLGHT_06235, partial [Acidimicrobiia bacterium]